MGLMDSSCIGVPYMGTHPTGPFIRLKRYALGLVTSQNLCFYIYTLTHVKKNAACHADPCIEHNGAHPCAAVPPWHDLN